MLNMNDLARLARAHGWTFQPRRIKNTTDLARVGRAHGWVFQPRHANDLAAFTALTRHK